MGLSKRPNIKRGDWEIIKYYIDQARDLMSVESWDMPQEELLEDCRHNLRQYGLWDEDADALSELNVDILYRELR